MKNPNKIIPAILFTLFLVSCAKVPLTGRRQMKLLPNSEVMSLSLTSYKEFLQKNPPLSPTDAYAQQVKTVGAKISSSVETFLKQKGYAERVKNYKWEFNAVDNKEVNAWCMPGGKVVAYTGLKPYSKDDAGLAVVIAHEIAHSIADHGNERMSQMLAVQLGGLALDIAMQKQPEQTRNLFLTAYGVGSTLGVLAYSRQHELEADRLGLIFMAMAGYNPERAITFWQDMSQKGGSGVPVFLSTHPSNATRIARMKKHLGEAKRYYKP